MGDVMATASVVLTNELAVFSWDLSRLERRSAPSPRWEEGAQRGTLIRPPQERQRRYLSDSNDAIK